MVHALVANDGYLIVSCSVEAIIHGRSFLFNCSLSLGWFGETVIIRSSNSVSVKKIANVVFSIGTYVPIHSRANVLPGAHFVLTASESCLQTPVWADGHELSVRVR